MKTNILYNMVNNIRVWAIMMVCLMVLGVGNAWGTDWSYTFSSTPTWSPTSGTTRSMTINSATWSVSTSNAGGSPTTWGTYAGAYSSGGIKFGDSGSNYYGTTTLSTDYFSSSLVSEVTVNLLINGSKSTTITVTQGVTIGSPNYSTGNTWYDFTANTNIGTSGTLTLEITTTQAIYIHSISVKYAAAIARKVTFNAQGGTCATSSLTEASAGAGVTLPAASPSSACASEGWGFYGWATSAVGTSTTSAPAIVGKAGDTYHPTDDITLHAVYAQGEYTKETSAITSGAKYLIVGNTGGHNYIMKSSSDDFKDYSGYNGMDAAQIDETSTGKYHAAAVYPQWCYTIEGTAGNYFIRDVVNSSSSNYADIAWSAWWGHAKDDDDKYTITVSSGIWTIKNNYYDDGYTYLGLDASDLAFFAYTSAQDILLYKAGTIYYYSNPSCCDKVVELSAGTKTNVSSITFSSDDVPTCSSTDTERRVTVTVTTNTGYKMVSDLSFAKASGTATATKKSGPTGSGPYTYVYEFNQNDNGTGTFSATATAKTYTVTLEGNGGTGHTASVTATYNSSTLSSSITNPEKTGYTFDGWYSGSGGTGSLVISKSGALQANVSTYTGAGGIWTRDAATTLYAKWTINKYKVTLAEPSTVTINATSPSSIAEGGNASIDYNTEVTLSYSSLLGGRQWCGWKVYKDGDPSTTVTVTSNKFNVPAYDVIVTAEVYGDFTFSCADLQLDEPDNGADNVLSDVIYLTSTSGQKVRSAAHFHVHGDGLTASQTVKFTTGDDDLDELYTFRKANGDEVQTDASGEVDEEVYIFYKPTATTDGRDLVTSVKAYVEKASASNNKPKAVVNEERTINGRHLPAQFIIAAKAGDYWYALPADMVSSGAHAGYSFTPNSSSAPTQANVAPEAAVYNFYGYATSSPYDSSFIRLASDKTSKALWSNKSNSSIGITNKAAIDGGSAKGEQYEWRLTNTGADTYNLWNHAANLTGRNLGLQKSDKKWNMYADGSTVVKELRILPVVSISAYIELLGEDWQESAFTYTKVSGTIPEHHHIQVTYNGDTYTATESGTTVTITDADFAAAGGFAAAPGTQLTLEWCNEDGNVLAQGSLFTPIFITSNTVNLSDYETDVLRTTDVFITNGAKLTVNENTTVHDVTVNAGSTLLVDKAGESTGATLTMSSGKLTLRGGWTTIGGDSKYDMPRVYINPLSTLAKTNQTINLYMDIFKSEDGKHYYPFAVPFAVAVNDVKYVDPTLAAAAVYNKHYVIKRYNGANRAENGTGDGNWEVVPAGSILKPGEGYIITAVAVGGKAQLVVPMKNVTNSWLALGEQATVSDSTKNVIKVTAHTGTATAGGGANNRHKGWNMVGVPFMSCYTSGTDMYSGVGSADLMSGRMELSGDVSDPYAWETSDVVYVSVPTHDFSEYIQTDITTAQLVPGWSFFIQVGTTGNLTFLTTKQAESSSTPLYAPQRETSPIVKTGIVLTGGEKSDKTTLIISDRYSTEYEIGADLEKMFGNGYTLATYSITGGMQLAFNAMSTEDVKQVIPVGVRLPEDGEYTFSLNSQYADADIERLDLIDYETGEVTNLMMSVYRFTATRSQNNDRFALNVVPMAKVPTGNEQSAISGQQSDVRKVILDDKMFIIRDGLMYDVTGKRVKEINK